ncbi:hypothetical protein Taro_051352, partial [Colocasia esculenta]|nr:hypothetical protein [Colocasia esculenta]
MDLFSTAVARSHDSRCRSTPPNSRDMSRPTQLHSLVMKAGISTYPPLLDSCFEASRWPLAVDSEVPDPHAFPRGRYTRSAGDDVFSFCYPLRTFIDFLSFALDVVPMPHVMNVAAQLLGDLLDFSFWCHFNLGFCFCFSFWVEDVDECDPQE